jgi:hypothetical protein
VGTGKPDGKTNRYYGISGEKPIGRERVDYNRESAILNQEHLHM